MGVSLSGQLFAFGLAAIVGAALGLVYDLLAVPARRLNLARWLFDLLFCGALVLTFVWFAMEVGGGELRMYAVLSAVLGATLYFLLLSPLTRGLCNAVLDIVLWLLSPFAAIGRWLLNGLRFLRKTDALYKSAELADKAAKRANLSKRGGGANAEEVQVYLFYRYRNHGLHRVRGVQSSRSAAKYQRTGRKNPTAARAGEGFDQRASRAASVYRL